MHSEPQFQKAYGPGTYLNIAVICAQGSPTMQDLIGRTLGHYRITAKPGRDRERPVPSEAEGSLFQEGRFQ